MSATRKLAERASIMIISELRAGIFIALGGMRAVLGNAGAVLTPAELQSLERLSSLYHDFLHGSLAMISILPLDSACYALERSCKVLLLKAL